MLSTQEKWQEIANRGLEDRFDPETRAKFDEAVRRGLISKPNTLQSDDGHSMGEGIANAAGQGLTMGFADEIQAGTLATFGKIMPESLGGLPEGIEWGEAYEGIRDEIRGRNNQFKEENPKTAFAAELVGGFATGGAGLAKTGLLKGGSAAGNTAKAGAVLGGTAGAGYSEGETIGEVAQDVVIGATVGAATGGALGAAGERISNKITQNAQLKNLLETNPDSRVAKLALNQSGKVVKDKAAIEAIDQGFDQGVVSVIKGASKEDKTLMRKMVGIYNKAKRNPTDGIQNRPLNVIGERIAQRYKHVRAVNREAGKQIDKAAESLKGESVDVSGFVDDFIGKLDDVGVKLRTEGRVSLDFDGSDLEGLTGAQKILSRVVGRMANTKEPDAYDVHRLKKYIDNNVTYGAGNKTGAEKQAENLIKQLRHNMDEMLDGRFADYDKANTLYAQTKNALTEVDSLIGKSSNVASDNFDKSLGTLARRISSNAMSGGRVDDAYSTLNEVAKSTGGKFADDLDTLLVFANEMERVLPTQARTSLQGVTDNVAGQALEASESPMRFAMNKAMNAVSKTRDDETRLKALRSLLIK